MKMFVNISEIIFFYLFSTDIITLNFNPLFLFPKKIVHEIFITYYDGLCFSFL